MVCVGVALLLKGGILTTAAHLNAGMQSDVCWAYLVMLVSLRAGGFLDPSARPHWAEGAFVHSSAFIAEFGLELWFSCGDCSS